MFRDFRGDDVGICMGNRFHHTPMFKISSGLLELKTLLVERLGFKT